MATFGSGNLDPESGGIPVVITEEKQLQSFQRDLSSNELRKDTSSGGTCCGCCFFSSNGNSYSLNSQQNKKPIKKENHGKVKTASTSSGTGDFVFSDDGGVYDAWSGGGVGDDGDCGGGSSGDSGGGGECGGGGGDCGGSGDSGGGGGDCGGGGDSGGCGGDSGGGGSCD